MPDSDDTAGGDPTQHFPAPGPGGDGWVLGNRYRVTGRIGAGGMADVFRAHDQLLNRDVAVKVFRSSAAGADTAAGAERQRAELHALARLNHPNLITLFDGSVAGPEDPESRAYLVMELVEGPNLGARIDTGPVPSEPEVRAIGAQVADALAYVHEQGMVHRDVKPANILLGAGTGSEQVRARLSDFGIVRFVGAERLTQADSTLGTASYLAPEQARGSAVGPAADIYALGLTLIEALTGVRSFDAPTPLEAVVARLDRDPVVPQNLPQPWPGLLAAMTARDPAARPAARQVSEALRGGGVAAATTRFAAPVAGGTTAATTVLPPTGGMPPVRPVAASVEPPLPEPGPKQRNVGLIVGLILAGVLILVAILIIVATSGDDGSDAPVAPNTSSSSSAKTTPTTPSGSDETSESSDDTTEPSSEPETSDETTDTPTEQSSTPTRTRTNPPTTSSPRTTPPTSSTSQTGTSDGNR